MNDYKMFSGDTPLAGLVLLREHAIEVYEDLDAHEGIKEMTLVADLALARVERLERIIRAQRASRQVESQFSRQREMQERQVQALLRPHGNVDNVHPIRRPKGAA